MLFGNTKVVIFLLITKTFNRNFTIIYHFISIKKSGKPRGVPDTNSSNEQIHQKNLMSFFQQLFPDYQEGQPGSKGKDSQTAQYDAEGLPA